MAALPAVLCRRAVALVLALVSAPSFAAAAARPVTETDMFRFTWVADPQISPDGRRVAFVRVTVNDKKDGYDTNMTGRAGKMSSRLSYMGVIGQYKKAMEDAISREQIPRDFHSQIRDYFRALDER